MDQLFTRKVRTAAVAAWWTVLVAYVILLVQWMAYLAITSGPPEWMLALWGAGVTWPEIRTIWLWGMVAFKFIVGMMLFAALWLTLWARQLAKK
jgi:hypothetical protein